MPPNQRRGKPKPSGLKVVPDPVGESGADTPFPIDAREAMLANLAKGRAKRALRQTEAKASRAAGEPSRVELYRAGKLPISEWTGDELAHGRPTNLDGSFGGIPPKFSPRESAAIRAQLLRHGDTLMQSWYPKMLKVLEEVATSGESEPSRVKAANLLIERIAGRTVERIEIKSADPWQDILDEIMNDDVLTRMQDSAVPGADPSDAER